jgi:hypothetical protein
LFLPDLGALPSLQRPARSFQRNARNLWQMRRSRDVRTRRDGEGTLLLPVDAMSCSANAGDMPWRARSVSTAGDVIYHVMNRGHRRMDVFQVEKRGHSSISRQGLKKIPRWAGA